MHKIHTLIAAAALLFCAVCSVSCNKDNPAEVNYASADFALKASEFRQSHTFEWDVLPSGQVSIPESEQKLQELWVTKWNTVTVFALPKDSKFEGVNFSSSDTRKVKVKKIDERTCELEWVGDTADGETVSINANAGSYSHTLRVYAKEVIELKGFHVEFCGYKFCTKLWPTDAELDGFPAHTITLNVNKILDGTAKDEEGQTVTIEGLQSKKNAYITVLSLEPENASFRYCTYLMVHYPNGTEESTLPITPYPQFVTDMDFSEIQGKTAFFSSQSGNGDRLVIRFLTNSKTKEKTEEATIRPSWFISSKK